MSRILLTSDLEFARQDSLVPSLVQTASGKFLFLDLIGHC